MNANNNYSENLTYFQFQKDFDYSLFVKVEQDFLNEDMKTILTQLGFNEITEKEFKLKDLKRYETKILKVKAANHKVARQISQSFMGMEKYGNENLSSQGNYEVYRFKNVGMMVLSQATYEWELGLMSNTAQTEGIKTMFTRFITWALMEQGVLAFWGVPVEEGLVVMNQKEANGEAVFLDIEKNKIITQDGTKALPAFIQFLRLDSSLRGETKLMSREELLSFLTTNIAYFSVSKLPYGLLNNIRSLIDFSEGIIYPKENFEPRSEAS